MHTVSQGRYLCPNPLFRNWHKKGKATSKALLLPVAPSAFLRENSDLWCGWRTPSVPLQGEPLPGAGAAQGWPRGLSRHAAPQPHKGNRPPCTGTALSPGLDSWDSHPSLQRPALPARWKERSPGDAHLRRLLYIILIGVGQPVPQAGSL